MKEAPRWSAALRGHEQPFGCWGLLTYARAASAALRYHRLASVQVALLMLFGQDDRGYAALSLSFEERVRERAGLKEVA